MVNFENGESMLYSTLVTELIESRRQVQTQVMQLWINYLAASQFSSSGKWKYSMKTELKELMHVKCLA